MKKTLKTLLFTGGVLCAAKGLDNRLEVTHYIMESPKIPKDFDNFKIVQISDYHSDPVPGLIGEIKCESPDVIVSTGDLIDDDGSYMAGINLCEKLVKIAPVYAVTGNHELWRSDYNEYENALSEAGVRTLHSERVRIERGNAEISICGADDPFSLEGRNVTDNINKLLDEIPPYDGYDILLFHRANHFESLKKRGYDLVLAGHMHGGQFRFPWGQGVVSPKSSWGAKQKVFFPKYFGGHYNYNSTEMLVSRGLGNPMIIPRLFNRPELVVVTLKHGEAYDE